MSITIHTTSRNAATVGEIVTARLRAAFSAIADWNRKRQAEKVLQALDDRMLDDIGIRRDEIHHYVWG